MSNILENNDINYCLLPEYIKTATTYRSTNLSNKFRANDKKILSIRKMLFIIENLLKKACQDDYTGETSRRIVKVTKDQDVKVKKSYLSKDINEKGRTNDSESDFKILGNNYHS